MRLSRVYKNGIGKPVVKKCWDAVIQVHRWAVIFPPRNNSGNWIVTAESAACAKAEDWCAMMNNRLRTAEATERIK